MKIGKFELNEKSPCFIVAEVSGNHGGSLKNALDIVRAAKKAGANAIKLQTYTPDTITLRSNSKEFLLPKSSRWAKHNNLWQLYSEGQTPWNWHKKIFNEAKKLGLEYFSSPFDETAVDFLESLEVPAYKIASPEITHIPLIRKVAATKKPIILSLGLASEEDLKLAIKTIKKEGNEKIIILKCTTDYPANYEDLNLTTITSISKTYGYITGLSDHSIGIEASIIATTLGAKLIEKHISLSKANTAIDSFFSASEKTFAIMVNSIRNTEKALGKPTFKIPEKVKKNLNSRRSLYLVKEIKKGEIFTEKHLKCIRPFNGLHPVFADKIIGKKSKLDLKKNIPLKAGYIKW